jgi:lipopolysaccharide transport system permease protein
VPKRWLTVFSLNPMTGLIEGFRAAFLGSPLDWSSAGISLAVSLLLALGGSVYFGSVERRLADII